jgi:hypothetical protein
MLQRFLMLHHIPYPLTACITIETTPSKSPIEAKRLHRDAQPNGYSYLRAALLTLPYLYGKGLLTDKAGNKHKKSAFILP